jgi:hypothetical protein
VPVEVPPWPSLWNGSRWSAWSRRVGIVDSMIGNVARQSVGWSQQTPIVLCTCCLGTAKWKSAFGLAERVLGARSPPPQLSPDAASTHHEPSFAPPWPQFPRPGPLLTWRGRPSPDALPSSGSSSHAVPAGACQALACPFFRTKPIPHSRM